MGKRHLGSIVVDHFLGGQVALVANKHLVHFIAEKYLSAMKKGAQKEKNVE